MTRYDDQALAQLLQKQAPQGKTITKPVGAAVPYGGDAATPPFVPNGAASGAMDALKGRLGGNTGINPQGVPKIQADGSYKTPPPQMPVEAPESAEAPLPPYGERARARSDGGPVGDSFGIEADNVQKDATPMPDATAPAEGAAPAEPANPNWDTDGYAAPAYTPQQFGSAMPGWDQEKWNDPNNQHPKYVMGRIFSNHIGDPAGVAEEAAKAYPGTTFNGKDKLDIPGVGVIDFVQAAGAGGTTFQWIPADAAGGAEGDGAHLIDNGGIAMPAPGTNTEQPIAPEVTSESLYRRMLAQMKLDPEQMALSTMLSQGGKA
jgi:hypothetical protein